MEEVVKSVVIKSTNGLHARPAARFAQEARRFDSRIVLEKDGLSADCKSVVSLLKLGAVRGSSVVLRAEGPDAGSAAAALEALLDGALEAES